MIKLLKLPKKYFTTKNYYQTLGVNAKSTLEEIEEAFKKI